MKIIFSYLVLFIFLPIVGYQDANQNVDISAQESLKRIELKDRVLELEDLLDTHQTAHKLYKKDAEDVHRQLQDEYSRYQELQKSYSGIQKQKEEGERSLSHKIKILEMRLQELEKMEDILVKERDMLRSNIEKDLMICLKENGEESHASHKQYLQMQKVIDALYDQISRSNEICNEKLHHVTSKHDKQKELLGRTSKKLKDIKKVILEFQRQKKVIKEKEKENNLLRSDLHKIHMKNDSLHHELSRVHYELKHVKQQLLFEKEQIEKMRRLIEVLKDERDRAREAFSVFSKKEMKWKYENERLVEEIESLRSENQQLNAQNLSLEMEQIELKTRVKQCDDIYQGMILRK
jgi:chromosome segregation ATPase